MSQQYPQDPNQQRNLQYDPQHPEKGWQPAQPYQPKKKHTLRTVLIVIGSVFAVLIVIGALAGSPDAEAPVSVTSQAGGATVSPPTTSAPTTKPAAPKATAPKATKPVEQAPKMACADQEDRNAPCTVQVGKPFRLGKHTVLSGWKVSSQYGTMAVTGKAKNTGDTASSMFVEIKFLSGDEVLADVSCTTDELEPGQTQAISCFSSDDYTKAYKRVTVEATF